MKNLDLLWELQKHSNTLNDIKNNFQQMVNGKEIEALKIKLNQTEIELMELEKRIDRNEKRLNEDNSILKEYDYHLKNIERDLYEGDITDLKQLNFLDSERKSMIKNIEGKEIEILEQLEEMEDLKKEFIRIEDDFKKFKKEYSTSVKKYKIAVEDFKQKLMKSKEEIDNISLKVDKNLLERYFKIKNNKGNAVAEVVDRKCSGCNMMLSTFMFDRLKNYDEIVFCESCGRILYLKR